MTRIKLLQKNLLFIGIPFLLFTILILFIKSPYFIVNDKLNLALTLDLILTIPFVYFLLIRKTKIPKTTVVPIMIIGLIIGNYILPKENQVYIELYAIWMLPIVELFITFFIILKIRKGVKAYKKVKGIAPDFQDAIKTACAEIVPKKVAPAFATEFSMIYYGFFNWKKRDLASNEFSYHQKTGSQALLGAFIFVITIEVVAIHFLLMQWSLIAAWILTGLSIYTAFQVFGAARSLSKRPIVIEKETLILRYGVLSEAQIPLTEIESIERTSSEFEKGKLTRTLSPIGDMEGVNLILKTRTIQTAIGLYGIKKKFKVLGLHVDQPDEFIDSLEMKIAPSE